MNIEEIKKRNRSNGTIYIKETGRKDYDYKNNLLQLSGEEYKDKDHCPCKKACRYHGNCKECVAVHRAHQEHVPNCMRPIINAKIKLLSELTEHTIANEIEAPHEILRKEYQSVETD